MSYVVVREVLGPHEEAYIARDRSDKNPKEAEELGTFLGTLNLV